MPDHNHWLLWQYRDDHNCWDFVRAVLEKEFNIPSYAIPKHGVCATDKAGIDTTYQHEKQRFIPINAPQNGAVACQYAGETLTHVGIVLNDFIFHASSRHGVRKTTLSAFLRIAKTRFYQWQY
jgi:hypothetical protein